MEKTLYWIVENNFEMSNTVQNLETAKEFIQNDFDCQDDQDKQLVQYTITPSFLTDEEYEALPSE